MQRIVSTGDGAAEGQTGNSEATWILAGSYSHAWTGGAKGKVMFPKPESEVTSRKLEPRRHSHCLGSYLGQRGGGDTAWFLLWPPSLMTVPPSG